MKCRREWHGLGAVFGPSRGRVRLYHECTWLASIRVGVVRVSRAITHGRCSRGGWAGMWGARRCRRLSRGGSYVWCMREPSTVTLRGRGRTSMGGACVAVTRRRTSAITLGSPVGSLLCRCLIFCFHISNMEPSVSCVTNSGFRRENTLAKAEGHHRRL